MEKGRNCNKCQIWKDATNFAKEKNCKSGLYSICSSCKKEYRIKNKQKIKEWHAKNYINNKEEIYQNHVKYRLNNKEKVKQLNKKSRNKPENIIKKREYKNQYYHKCKKDLLYNMQIRLRNRLRAAFNAKNWRKNNNFNSIIGCSKKELKQYIESKFQSGMNWNNRNLWHLDHIIPVSKAQTIQELEILFHYTNLQPLWAEDNIKKSDSCLAV